MKLDLFKITMLLAIILMIINAIRYYITFQKLDILNGVGVIVLILVFFKTLKT